MKTLVQNTIFNGKTWFAISMVQDVSTSLGVLKLRKERNFALQFCLEFDQNLLVHSVKGCSSRFRLFWKENYALLLEEEEQLSKPTSKGLFTCSQVLLTLWEQFNTTTASTAVTRLWGLSSLATKDILKSLGAFFGPKKKAFQKDFVDPQHISQDSHCLKITQTVAFEFLNFGIFHQFLSY